MGDYAGQFSNDVKQIIVHMRIMIKINVFLYFVLYRYPKEDLKTCRWNPPCHRNIHNKILFLQNPEFGNLCSPWGGEASLVLGVIPGTIWNIPLSFTYMVLFSSEQFFGQSYSVLSQKSVLVYKYLQFAPLRMRLSFSSISQPRMHQF